MQRVSDIVGKPIVSSSNGANLGSVADGLIDDSSARLCALVVGGGVFVKEQVLPFDEVRTFGADTVLARSDAVLVTAQDWRAAGTHATRSSSLRGRPVVTSAGQKVGVVSDLMIDETTGSLDAIEVSTSDYGGLLRRRSVISRSPDIRIGPDAIVVPDTAVASDEDDRRPGA